MNKHYDFQPSPQIRHLPSFSLPQRGEHNNIVDIVSGAYYIILILISDILLKVITIIPMCSASVSSDLLGLRKTNARDIAAAAIPSASVAYVYILYYYIVLINCYFYNIIKNDRTKRHTIRPTTDGLRSAAPRACANHRMLICYV